MNFVGSFLVDFEEKLPNYSPNLILIDFDSQKFVKQNGSYYIKIDICYSKSDVKEFCSQWISSSNVEEEIKKCFQILPILDKDVIIRLCHNNCFTSFRLCNVDKIKLKELLNNEFCLAIVIALKTKYDKDMVIN